MKASSVLVALLFASASALRLPSLPSRPSFKRTAGIKPLRASGLYDPANVPNAEECDIAQPTNCGEPDGPLAGITRTLNELQEKGFGAAALLGATAVSLSLANGPSSAWWCGLWESPLGPAIGGHALSARAWVNEGLMGVFFFLVGLEIKEELRHGALTSVKKAALPAIAALGGMVTPMAVYAAAQGFLPVAARSLSGLAVPMATDIAFAMAIFGLFRSKMPASSSAFLLTLATVDDFGAIFVLATCFAANVSLGFLGLASALTAALGWIGCGPRKCNDARVFTAGGVGIWWSLLRAGVSAEVAGVLAALCVSTTAEGPPGAVDDPLAERMIRRLAPLSTFGIMPLFALANTGIPLMGVMKGVSGPGAGAAAGIAAGLVLGKPLGIFGFTWLATKLNIADMPTGMGNNHLSIVSMLGAIGFTMCLLLTEVAIPAPIQALPKLSVLVASTAACVAAAAWMSKLPDLKQRRAQPGDLYG